MAWAMENGILLPDEEGSCRGPEAALCWEIAAAVREFTIDNPTPGSGKDNQKPQPLINFGGRLLFPLSQGADLPMRGGTKNLPAFHTCADACKAGIFILSYSSCA